ncbi:uncharacterized protein DUF4352 [Nocardiopsis sp. Huas11]|uniref:DUF4352 domain-containing protein n=1 Tax=Nocardiopsis sp. Huas11 TaxID=2183912 RepID=UPI000F22F2A0|nr:DUF4352 domain-containing protein [Nocardiopsis sp. Huas11]RKS07629.1 uncharacterized protein DUF4352 [Nocardiopsis sp. Huas11]
MSYPQYPTGGQPPYGPPPKKGMSTGAKIGIGCGGCLVIVILGFVVLAVIGALASGSDDRGSTSSTSSSDSSSEETAEESGGEDAPAAESESGVTMTATGAGTAEDITGDGTVYTAIDIEVVNDSDEPIDVNPINFTAVLADGTVVSDWADSIFADIDQIDAVTLQPGQRTSGQIAVVGEVDVATVEMNDLLGMGDPIVADVQ